MRKKYLLSAVLLLCCFTELDAQKLWGDLKPGTYSVGFKTIKEQDKSRDNRPMVICIWYPAKNKTQKMSFRDYLYTGIINETFSEPTREEKIKFAKEYKETFPQLYEDISESSMKDFDAVLDMPMLAEKNAAEAAGKFPTVLMSSEPESLAVTAEWLASNGFVVVAIHTPYNMVMPPEPLVWDAVTKDMIWLTEYTKNIQNIDQTKMAALGFGGGIIPSFFLTMHTTQLKALVNLEGAVFQPFSLITKSVHYHSEKMKTPMLHIISQGTRKNESDEEIKAINTKLYRLLVKNSKVSHQDFSSFGRIANRGLEVRPDVAANAEVAYVAAHELILRFFNSHLRDNSTPFGLHGIETVFYREQ